MICGSRSRREVLVSSPLCRSLSDIFFLRLPVASVVSFQVLFKGNEAGNTRFFGQNTTQAKCGVEIFPKTVGLTFYFQSPLPYLCTWTQRLMPKERPSGGKKIRATNEMGNFREVLEMHYRLLFHSFGIAPSTCDSSGRKEVAQRIALPSEKFRWKKSMACSMLLASGVLQGGATEHESGRWSLRRRLLSCGRMCK